MAHREESRERGMRDEKWGGGGNERINKSESVPGANATL